MTKSHQLKAFFTEDEIAELKEAMYGFFNSMEPVAIPLETIAKEGRPTDKVLAQEWSGRALFVATDKIPRRIADKIEKYARDNYGEDLKPDGYAFTRYSPKYGTPRLAPHYDTGHSTFTIDYQLESNVEWKLVVENKEYSLEDNDALVFKPSYEVHWRKHTILKDNEYVDMIFFHFHDGKQDDYGMTKEIKKLRESAYQENFQKEFINLHGWDYWHGNRL